MQGRLGGHATKPLLTALHAQALIPNVDKDVVPAVEGAEGDFPAPAAAAELGGGHLHHPLDEQDGFFQLLAREAVGGIVRVDPHRAFLAEDRRREIEAGDAGLEGGFGGGKEGLDGRLGPGLHAGEDPVAAVDVAEEVGGSGVEDEEVVGFAAHDDEVLFLAWAEQGGVADGVEEAMEAGVVFGGVGVAGGGDDADEDVVGEEVD